MGFGHFIGTVKAEWIDDGRNMRLIDRFIYVDPNSTEWVAASGSVINGASIPRLLWSFAGSPFTGEYRDASVVHDVACQERKRAWQAVHEMFYLACRAGGVGEIKAKVIYGMVYKFGPRWGLDPRNFLAGPDLSIEEANKLKDFIERKNPTLEDIRLFGVRGVE